MYGRNAPFNFEPSADPKPSGAQTWVDPHGTYVFAHEKTDSDAENLSDAIDWHRHLPVADVALSQEEHDL